VAVRPPGLRVVEGDVRLDDDLVTNYFDKLIQVPVRVPPLGTQDVRAYLMLLYVENSGLPEPKRDAIREAVCRQLSETWKGKRVDARFVRSLIEDCPSDLSAKLELADRLAPLMTTTKQILGNPRLIKRFLNTLSIRLSTAKAQGVTVDEAALAKMLLFERSGKDTSYRRLVSAVNESDEGKPTFLGDWEKAIRKGEAPPALEAGWDDEFSKSWLALEPAFSDLDLRAVVYVSRDHLPIITAADQLSAEGINILEGLLAIVTAESRDLTEQLKLLAPREVQQILSRLLQKARPVQQWGVPPILYACLTVASVGDEHAKRVADFLKELPPKQLNAGIIPLIASKPWAPHVLAHWSSQIDTPDPVKRAIAASSKKAG
ncbi:MAG: P-loop NTPase fold protein, partial [Hyphomicrobium sp.]